MNFRSSHVGEKPSKNNQLTSGIKILGGNEHERMSRERIVRSDGSVGSPAIDSS